MFNVVTTLFRVDSEAFQAFTELRSHAFGATYTVSEAALVTKADHQVVGKDFFDTGVDTADDTGKGLLVGSLVGVLGGPVGVALGAAAGPAAAAGVAVGAAAGAAVGSAADARDARQNASLMEWVSTFLLPGQHAIVALVEEADDGAFDANMDGYDCVIVHRDAVDVADEIEVAREIEKEVKKKAAKALRKVYRTEKKIERKVRRERRRAAIAEHFDSLKAKARRN